MTAAERSSTTSSVNKGCGLILALWLVLAGAYGYVAWQKTRELVPAAMIAVLGSQAAAMLIFAGRIDGRHRLSSD